ncbi:glycosyltransferase (plasmid) [Halobaculum sp. CBA1158]|uniref:glycosyltransferase n=1 Tax=Halobaculum sp. CBA1158 TaxID=2904243 RepID=UPI001F1D66FB|nr:glycosyltransferase [Halobaculum sp. CBA1158]UIP01467.1 glycosyltransferase [Halobaculum sp. CBA1158]
MLDSAVARRLLGVASPSCDSVAGGERGSASSAAASIDDARDGDGDDDATDESDANGAGDDAAVSDTRDSADRLRVLSLSANPRANFYRQQVTALTDHGVTCTTIGPPPYSSGSDRSPVAYLRVWAATVREAVDGYDVVHANYGTVTPLAIAQPTRPVVVTLWGSDVMADGAIASVSKRVACLSDAVVAPSRRLARELPCESHVVEFDVDTELFRPIPRNDARRLLGWDPDERVVLFPYDSRPVKDLPLARRVVDRLPVEARLRRVSGVDYESMPLYYNACDALLITSRREAGPMTVKEAAACNTPVVSTDVGFAADLLDGVRNSHVVTGEAALADRLAAVLCDGHQADGRERIRSRNDMGQRLRDVYESVL